MSTLHHIPGPGKLSLLIDPFRFRLNYIGTIKKRISQYGPIFSALLLPHKQTVVTDPDFFEFALKDHPEYFLFGAGIKDYIADLTNFSLPLQEGEEHKSRKKLVHEKFSHAQLTEHLKYANTAFQTLLALLGEKASSPISIHTELANVIMEISGVNIMSCPFNSASQELKHTIVAMIDGVVRSIIRKRIPFTNYDKAQKAAEKFTKIVYQLIPLRKNSDLPDLFTAFCNQKFNGVELSNEEIRGQIAFMLMAALDTTSSSIAMTLLELGRNPEWKEAIYQEALSYNKPTLGIDDIEHIKIIDAVYSESLRKYPPISTIPYATICDFNFKDYSFKKDQKINLNLMGLQNNPNIWPDPEIWDPNRFLDNNLVKSRSRFAYLPFGFGPHICCGYKIAPHLAKAFLFQLILRFDFEVVSISRSLLRNFPYKETFSDFKIRLIER